MTTAPGTVSGAEVVPGLSCSTTCRSDGGRLPTASQSIRPPLGADGVADRRRAAAANSASDPTVRATSSAWASARSSDPGGAGITSSDSSTCVTIGVWTARVCACSISRSVMLTCGTIRARTTSRQAIPARTKSMNDCSSTPACASAAMNCSVPMLARPANSDAPSASASSVISTPIWRAACILRRSFTSSRSTLSRSLSGPFSSWMKRVRWSTSNAVTAESLT